MYSERKQQQHIGIMINVDEDGRGK